MKLFVIVEGRRVDRPFYDRIFRSLGGLNEADFEICLAEDIELCGKAAAGKRHALALFSEWQRKQVLVQSNSIGTRIIAVAVDRDLDGITGRLIGSNHVLYSYGADVEADILRHGDVRQAIADAYSLSRHSVSRILAVTDLFGSLAALWREWLLLAARGAACGSSVSYGRVSLVNDDCGYGAFNESAERSLRRRIDDDAAANGTTSAADTAEKCMVSMLTGAEPWRVIKGKWVASYLHHSLETARLRGEVIESGVSVSTVVKTCMASLELRGDLSDYHEANVSRLLTT